ncbi:MAG: hypothetical protein COA80_19080 [Leeuwenhoekiella sp.]|nr:MAG: hypothetical protein COA80_19080 [Leeuwenhoekiella sp.]
MLAYLIKSILCLLVLWGFYKITLEQTAAHYFKRFYLLGSLVLALTLPLITFSYTVEVEPQTVVAETYFEPVAFTEAPDAAPVDEPTNWLLVGLGIIYVAGVLLFGFRFLRNLNRLRHKIASNEKVRARSHINVLLTGKVVPHSFLRFIFLPRKDFKNNTIAPEILAHEQAHVTQKHSWDILAVEFLQVIFWFNPLLVFLKRSIALNHEFLADRAALAQNTTTENYTNLLFTYSGGAHHTALSSPINYSLTKKRILMLSKTKSIKKLATRLALFVPVLALCIYFFNEEIVAKPVYLKTLPSTNKLNTGLVKDSIDYSNINYNSSRPDFDAYQQKKEFFENKNIGLINCTTWRWAIKNHRKVEGNEELSIFISDNTVKINGEKVEIDLFVKKLNSITQDWSQEQAMLYELNLAFDSEDNPTYLKLAKLFKKTRLYQIDPSHNLALPKSGGPELLIKEVLTIGGNFYLNDTLKITSDKALDLLKSNKYDYVKYRKTPQDSMSLYLWPKK